MPTTIDIDLDRIDPTYAVELIEDLRARGVTCFVRTDDPCRTDDPMALVDVVTGAGGRHRAPDFPVAPTQVRPDLRTFLHGFPALVGMWVLGILGVWTVFMALSVVLSWVIE